MPGKPSERPEARGAAHGEGRQENNLFYTNHTLQIRLAQEHTLNKWLAQEHTVSSHNSSSQTNKLRVSDPRAIHGFHFSMPFESSKFPGAHPIFPESSERPDARGAAQGEGRAGGRVASPFLD